MITLFALALLATPDGSRIADDASCYAITRMRDGVSQPVGVTWQTVRRDVVDGVDVLRVLVHQRGVGGRFDMKDSFVLRRSDMAPISFENERNGHAHVSLRYTDGQVTGRRIEDGVEAAIDQDIPANALEGNLYGVNFASLPLAPGAEFELPFYQYDQGVGAFRIKVAGDEQVATPEGEIPAWVVDLAIGETIRITYLIAKDGGRELGYRGSSFTQMLGGDCSEIDGSRGAAAT